MFKPIRVVESTVRRLDPAEIALALGAELAGASSPAGGPRIMKALHAGTYIQPRSEKSPQAGSKSIRQLELDIPARDWSRLEVLASELSAPNASPSPGQVASILLSLALDTVKPVGESNGERPDPALAKKLAEKVASST